MAATLPCTPCCWTLGVPFISDYICHINTRLPSAMEPSSVAERIQACVALGRLWQSHWLQQVLLCKPMTCSKSLFEFFSTCHVQVYVL